MNDYRIARYTPEQVRFFQYYLTTYCVLSFIFLINKPDNYLNLWNFAIYLAINGFITTLLTPISFIYKSTRFFNLLIILLNIIFIACMAIQNGNALIYYFNTKPSLLFYLFFMFLKFVYLYLYIIFFKIEENQYIAVGV